MRGKLIQNDVHLEKHEWKTVKTLLDKGYNIELVKPSEIKGYHLADIIIDGVYWEIKSPQGKGKNTIRHNMQNAGKQSENAIIDLQRCGIPDEIAIGKIKHELSFSKSLKRVKVITKQNEILDFSDK